MIKISLIIILNNKNSKQMQKIRKNKKSISKQAQEMLDEMFNSVKPKARYMSQLHVQEYTDSIYKQIINGDIEISKQSIKIQNSPMKYELQENLRKKFMSKAEREKSQLEHRLGYITNSINSMRKYDSLKTAIKSPRTMRVSFSDSSPRDSQWKKEIKKRDQALKKKKQAIEQEKKRKMLEQENQKKKMQEQKIENKKKLILQHMKIIDSRMKSRQDEVKQGNKRYSMVKRQKSMFQKLSENYESQEKSILQERKKRLAQIRSLHQPINEQEIKEHQQKFLALKRQKEEIRQRQKKMNESRTKNYQNFYQSSFYKKVVEEQNKEPTDSNTLKMQKMKQFSEHVKEHFVPAIDQKKRQQIQEFIEKQKARENEFRQKQRALLEMSKIKGIQYLSNVRSLPKKKRDKNKEINQLKAPETQRIVYKNYLSHNLTNSDVNVIEARKKHWEKILNSDDDKQSKAIKLQIQSQKLEQELKRKQKKARILKSGDSSQIDQEYFHMIKAKLDLLEEN